MPPRLTRRRYVAAAGAAALLGAGVRPVAGEQSDACDRLAAARAELETRREYASDLQADLEAATARVADLRAELETLDGVTPGPSPFDDAVVEQARSVGESARDAVMVLDVSRPDGSTGEATGWFVEEGFVVTNSHNVADAASMRGWSLDGDRFDVELVDRVADEQPDVALLRTDYAGRPLPVGSTATVAPDLPLVQVGHPGGFGYWVVSLGAAVSTTDDTVVSTVPGLQGNSGSPVLDLDGRVVAMTYGGRSPEAGREPGTAPEPASPEVHDAPFAPRTRSLHVDVDTTMARVEAWT